MAQWVKAFTTKLSDPSSILEFHIMKRGKDKIKCKNHVFAASKTHTEDRFYFKVKTEKEYPKQVDLGNNITVRKDKDANSETTH